MTFGNVPPLVDEPLDEVILEEAVLDEAALELEVVLLLLNETLEELLLAALA